ncbi:MAG: MFS transporter [Sandaracinaceae bacterium]|nr:MFS transporter [Sandaracinaceae bacterium]
MSESSLHSEAGFRERAAFCMFDFANSAFPTVALTAFGGSYFQSVLVGARGLRLGPLTLGPTAAWGVCISLAMALVTLTSPIMGAFADSSGRKHRLLSGYVGVCVAACAALAFVPPGAGLTAFVLYVVANFAFEGAYVFYNAFLPELVPPERFGRLSGQAWALGYVGGLLALFAVKPLIPKDYSVASAGHASYIYLIVAAWYLLFSIPALIWLKDRVVIDAQPLGALARRSFAMLATTLRALRRYRMVVIFLAAYFLYTDALTTFYEFAGIFTKDVLAFSPSDNVTLFLILNVVAAPGAWASGYLVDKLGGKRSILITLLLWLVVVAGAALTRSKESFFGVAMLAAVVIGATQAASRAVMARIAPRKRMGEFMGLLSLSGKASSILGPTLYGVVVDANIVAGDPGHGHRVAITVIGSFFLIALVILLQLDERVAAADAEREIV